MRHARSLSAAAGLVVWLSAPAAAQFMDFFGDPGPSWSNDGPSPDAPFPGMYRAPHARNERARRRSANASRLKRGHHVEVRIHHPEKADPKIQAYLMSPAYTQRFGEKPVGGAPDGVGEAVDYLLRNDPTLRPGDAVVTGAGVFVLDGGFTREFLPAAQSHLRWSVKARLLAIVPGHSLGPKPRQRAGRQLATFVPSTPSPRVSFGQVRRDWRGRLIRFVGGAPTSR